MGIIRAMISSFMIVEMTPELFNPRFPFLLEHQRHNMATVVASREKQIEMAQVPLKTWRKNKIYFLNFV
jgi:hypothetical protein